MTIDDASTRPASYEEFFTLHFSTLRGYCRSQTRDWWLATVATTYALEQVHDRWQEVQAKRRPIAYLMRVAGNYLKDQFRSNRDRGNREHVHASSWHRTNPDLDVGGGVVDRAYVQRLLSLLPAPQAKVLWFYAHGFKDWETAENLGCAVGTVANLRKRGLDALQLIIEDENRRDEDAS